MSYRIINVGRQGLKETSYPSKMQFLAAMHKYAERLLGNVHHNKVLTTDMDGVQIYHDNAKYIALIVGGKKALDMFPLYAELNIKAWEKDCRPPLCWYAPTIFLKDLLKGLSPEIARAVGKRVALIPGEKQLNGCLRKLGYDITSVTAGLEESAEEVSLRGGIDKTLGTRFAIDPVTGLYSDGVEMFIGGEHKKYAVLNILGNNGNGEELRGTHIGDSHSDIETLEAIPNSIAFNPKCLHALKNAKISIIGTSKLGLLPLFDHEGKHDAMISPVDLPRALIMMDEYHPDAGPLLKVARATGNEKIRSMVEKPGNLEMTIMQALKRQGVEHKTMHEEFMHPEIFDTYAKMLYER